MFKLVQSDYRILVDLILEIHETVKKIINTSHEGNELLNNWPIIFLISGTLI